MIGDISNSGNISDVCNGKRTSAKGFIFRHASPDAKLDQLSLDELRRAQRDAIRRGLEQEEEEGDEEEKAGSNINAGAKSNQKMVQVVSSKGHVLAVYQSQNEAERRVRINRKSISAVCAGKRASTKGFIFQNASPQATLNQLSLDELRRAQRDTEGGGLEYEEERGGTDEEIVELDEDEEEMAAMR
jgi:hypothetical protein